MCCTPTILDIPKRRQMNGPWFDHVLEWWEAAQADPEHILFLHYEAMLAEPEEHIRMIADFADIQYTQDVLAKASCCLVFRRLPSVRSLS